jgi:hypothetical protein
MSDNKVGTVFRDPRTTNVLNLELLRSERNLNYQSDS